MTDQPQRIQRTRVRGYKMPPGARSVARPSRWANPYRMKLGHRGVPLDGERERVVELFRAYADERLEREPGWLDPIVGKDLACYCIPGALCHGDVLIEMANDPERLRRRQQTLAAQQPTLNLSQS